MDGVKWREASLKLHSIIKQNSFLIPFSQSVINWDEIGAVQSADQSNLRMDLPSRPPNLIQAENKLCKNLIITFYWVLTEPRNGRHLFAVSFDVLVKIQLLTRLLVKSVAVANFLLANCTSSILTVFAHVIGKGWKGEMEKTGGWASLAVLAFRPSLLLKHWNMKVQDINLARLNCPWLRDRKSVV